MTTKYDRRGLLEKSASVRCFARCSGSPPVPYGAEDRQLRRATIP